MFPRLSTEPKLADGFTSKVTVPSGWFRQGGQQREGRDAGGVRPDGPDGHKDVKARKATRTTAVASP